jgi:hypothetical protein
VKAVWQCRDTFLVWAAVAPTHAEDAEDDAVKASTKLLACLTA